MAYFQQVAASEVLPAIWAFAIDAFSAISPLLWGFQYQSLSEYSNKSSPRHTGICQAVSRYAVYSAFRLNRPQISVGA
jgi:hypothetical protein